MALTNTEKKRIIKKHRLSTTDTGSSEVQIALLTNDINKLKDHFSRNHKDNHSRRGLLNKVNMRRKILAYLKNKDFQRYSNIIKQLGLRH